MKKFLSFLPVFATLLGLVWVAPSNGQIENLKVLDGTTTYKNPVDLRRPYIEEDPFDLVYLDKLNKNSILKIEPLQKPPQKPFNQDDIIRFDFKEESEFQYQVPLARVVDYKTYNQILLEEGDIYLREKKYSEALRNLLYVYDNGGKRDPTIVDRLNETLFLDAATNFKNKKYELSLSIFEDIYKKNPDFKPGGGLDYTVGEVIMLSYEGILRKHFEKGEFLRTRNLLASVARRYPDDSKELQQRWQTRFDEKSDELVARARKFAAEENGRDAHMMARRANALFPGRQSNKDLYDEIVKQFPYIFVGVQASADKNAEDKFSNWQDRRHARLTQRSLFEFVGTSDEGGVYDFIGGQIRRVDEIGLKYEIELTPTLDEFGKPTVNAYQVASLLNSYGSKANSDYSIPWAKVIKQVAIENENLVTFSLHFPFVRPESLLQIPLQARDANNNPVNNGKYVQTGVDGDFTTYQVNPVYAEERQEGRQYPRILEQRFRDSSDAIDALIKGDIDVVDQVPLSDIAKLRKVREIEVRSYQIPTVHMLIPNLRNDFMKNPNFRMGALRGINRELLVEQVLCGGQELGGCEVISGPWPIGTEDSDQLAYGYNMGVRPFEYNLRLGMVLVELTTQMINDREKKKNPKAPKIERPVFVLAHPDNYVANLACQTIQQNWTEIGMKVNLRRLKPGETVPNDDEWDFLYLSASIEEPLSDAEKLFGVDGLVRYKTAPIEQSMRLLSKSPSWQQSCATLRRMHRQAANDLLILPLYQLSEYMAFRNNVRGIGRDLIHLYQEVDRWTITSTYKKPDK